VIRHDVKGMADLIEAYEAEILALTSMDPYDPQITLLQERLEHALEELYLTVPRGV
jgi:hypothetical protein